MIDKLHNLEDLIGIKDCDGLSGPKEIMRRAEMQYDVVKTCKRRMLHRGRMEFRAPYGANKKTPT